MNARSCRNKPEEINDLITHNKLDVLLITETWLYKEGDEPIIASLCPPGFKFKPCPRENRRGGGIATIYRESLETKIKFVNTQHLKTTTLEIMELCLDVGDKSFDIVCYYRLQNSKKFKVSIPTFISEFEQLLSYLSRKKGHLLLAGDMNFQKNTW